MLRKLFKQSKYGINRSAHPICLKSPSITTVYVGSDNPLIRNADVLIANDNTFHSIFLKACRRLNIVVGEKLEEQVVIVMSPEDARKFVKKQA